MEEKEIIPGFKVGDTVILEKETAETKLKGVQVGTVGVVTLEDNKKTLEGWKVIDLESRFKEAVDKLSPDEVSEIFKRLVDLGQIKLTEDSENINNTNEKNDDGNDD